MFKIYEEPEKIYGESDSQTGVFMGFALVVFPLIFCWFFVSLMVYLVVFDHFICWFATVFWVNHPITQSQRNKHAKSKEKTQKTQVSAKQVQQKADDQPKKDADNPRTKADNPQKMQITSAPQRERERLRVCE